MTINGPQQERPECEGEAHQPVASQAERASGWGLEKAARIFRAAGDASRLRLLEELMDGERCVTELADAVGAGLSTVSQQLRILRSEDLVATRREGKHIFYSLADEHITHLITNVLAHAGEGSGQQRDTQ